jgi:hypothetical protein
MIQGTNAWICLDCGNNVEVGEATQAPAAAAPSPVTPPPAVPPVAAPSVVSPVAAEHIATINVPDAPIVVPPLPTPTVSPVVPAVPTPPASTPNMVPPPASAALPVAHAPLTATTPATHPAPIGLPVSPAVRAQKRRIKLWMILVPLIVALLAAGAAGAWYYQYKVAPTQAFGAYLKKTVGATSGIFKGTLSYRSDNKDGFIPNVSISYDAKYDGTQTNDEKLFADLKGTYLTESITASTIVTQKAVYLKLGTISILKSFGIVTNPNDWYKFDTEEAFKDECEESYNPQSFLNQLGGEKLPVKDTQFVGWNEKIDGHNTTHYKGTIDFGRLQAVIDEANTKLSANCKITYKADDFNSVVVTYDLWESKNFDRLSIRYNDTKGKYTVDMTVDSLDYNKPVTIDIPSQTKSFEELFSGSSTVSPPVSVDDKRRNDAAMAVARMEEYAANNNGLYPASTTTVAAYMKSDTGLSKYSWQALPGGYKAKAVAGKCPTAVTDSTSILLFAVKSDRRDYNVGVCTADGNYAVIK